MRFVNEMTEGDQLKSIYLCKKLTNAQTKAGKAYQNVTLADKTGSVDAKIWDPDSPGIGDFEAGDYVWIMGEVTIFMDKNQVNIRRARKAVDGEYDPADYVPTSDKSADDMYGELCDFIDSVQAPYMNKLLRHFFCEDEEFKKAFVFHSAAKSVHHGFVGGLLEHTLSVTKICDFFSKNYPFLDRDLLITAAICHDMGKIKELSPYPKNDYTDEGQLIGHIVIGVNMISRAIEDIEDFPKVRADELMHCIIAHHGELEFGSPKKPALIEALALAFADNTDAKIETFREAAYKGKTPSVKWQGFNRFLDSNIRRTSVDKEQQ